MPYDAKTLGYIDFMADNLSKNKKCSIGIVTPFAKKSRLNLADLLDAIVKRAEEVGAEGAGFEKFKRSVRMHKTRISSSSAVYLEALARQKGYKTQYDREKFERAIRLASIVAALEGTGMSREMAIRVAEKRIKPRTARTKKMALEIGKFFRPVKKKARHH